MAAKRGKHTVVFGRWLTQYLHETSKYQEYLVYYDHGDQETSRNVAKIKGFYGDTLSRQSQLADVDVMVATPDQKIVMLIELEESECRPKLLVGDLVSILLCARFSVRQARKREYFEITRETRLVIACVVPPGSSKLWQIEDVILPRLRQFSFPGDSINTKNIDLVVGSDIEIALDKLRAYLKERFRQHGRLFHSAQT